jgi:hypothetical protein
VRVRVASRSRRWGLSLLGLLLSVVLGVVIVAPALTREAAKQTKNVGDPGREMALLAGCDMSQAEVSMEVGEYDYVRGAGVATVEEAVLGMRPGLARDGTPFSTEELKAAVAAADLDTDPIEVRLPGATLTIDRTSEGKYLVVETVQCA